MPSLEIICLGQPAPSDVSWLPFTVHAEDTLVSHRVPTPLFQADFDKMKGCIYHFLGQGKVTAFDLLKRDWYKEEDDYNVEFSDEFAPSVKQFLEKLLAASPEGEILFTTDYQFGPGIEKHGPMRFSEFWQLHNAGQVKMNASYLITAS